MSLRNQPYLPLYVQDYLTDEKLNLCSLATQGVYIKIMCIFHKSETYGGILLKQKDKQKENICLNFAYKLAKLLPINLADIESALNELLDEKVLLIEDDFLFQKRMLKDGKLSETRALIGKEGGKKTQEKYKNFAKAKNKANTEYEYENINNSNINNWRKDYNIYITELNEKFEELKKDVEWLKKMQKIYPGIDIIKSMEQSIIKYWGTETGWKKKASARTKSLDWKKTFANTIEFNKVEKSKQQTFEAL